MTVIRRKNPLGQLVALREFLRGQRTRLEPVVATNGAPRVQRDPEIARRRDVGHGHGS